MLTIFDRATLPEAPDGVVLDAAGRQVTLSEVWGAASLTALVFTRHFGCVFCWQQVQNLVANEKRLREAGLAIAVVGPASARRVKDFAEKTKAPFPIYGDPTGEVFRTYGLHEGNIGQLLNPRVVARSMAEALRGNVHLRRRGNSRQMPGAALVDRSGRLLALQVAEDASDHLMAEGLLNVVKTVQQLERANI
jgi:peroxiredoxin